MPSADALAELQRWYLAQCDNEWEHSFGVIIDTLDNPGWRIKIDLPDTPMSEQPYERAETHRSGCDWVVSWRDERHWEAACGPLNLDEALRKFLDWVAAP